MYRMSSAFYDILIIVGIGLILGVGISLFFGVHSTSTASHFTRELFGMTSQTFLFYVTLFIVAFATALYTAFCVLIRDSTYPSENPLRFTTETIVVSAVPAAVIFVMAGLRGVPVTSALFIKFATLLGKFAVGHLLLQFSGIYSSMFNHE